VNLHAVRIMMHPRQVALRMKQVIPMPITFARCTHRYASLAPAIAPYAG
jgi:hypothetical protein